MTTTLADAIGGKNRVIGGPFGSNLTQKDYQDTGVPVIRGGNMGGTGRSVQGPFAFVSTEKFTRDLTSNAAIPGDIIVTQRGTLGQVAILPDDAPHQHYVVSQSQMAVRVDRTKADRDFVYYFLTSPVFNDYIGVTSIQTGVPHINLGLLRDVEVEWPPLPEQRAIAATLGALDDKIELNRKMNATLEALARALFRDWFVDFGPTRAKMEGRAPTLSPDLWPLFPDRLGDEGKPEGWAVRTLGDVADQIAMGPFGSNIKVETFVDEGIPVISGAHLRGMQLSDKDYNFVTETHADKLGRSNVRRGDVVFTHAGNIGQVAIIPETSAYDRYVISQRQFYLRCNLQLMSPLYVVHYFHSPEGKHTLLANSSQVGVPSIARPASYLKSIEICCPPRDLLDEFDRAVSVLHLKVGKNERESRTLAQTRDLLLPRLMSGKLRVADLSASEQETAA